MRSLFSWRGFRSGSSSATTPESLKLGWSTAGESSTESMRSGPTSSSPGSVVAMSRAPGTRALVLQAALNGLFTAKWFDICTVDTVLGAIQVSRDSEAYRLLRALHCIHYDKMPKELLERLPYLVNEALTPPVTACLATDIAIAGLDL